MIRNDRRLLRSSTRYMPFLGLRRPYEPIRMPSTSTGFTHTQIVQKRPFLSAAFAAVRDAPLKALEKAANADPGNSMKQLNFLQALTDRYPAAAVRRFESPGYNYCENAFREYVRACELSGAEVKNFKPPAGVAAAGEAAAVNAAAGMRGVEGAQYAHATPQQYAQYGGLGGGGGAGSTNGTSSSRPLYVSLGEGGGWKTQAWKTGRILAVTFIFVTAFGAMLDSQGLGSRLPGSKDSSVQQSTSSDKRFKDVVGVDEAKNELEEIVDYLREPGKFTKLGGKLPRGVLLTGPPGTGKTLLAKAIAGEAGVPFFYCSGSGFEEVYVGVGARRVRDLFESAKKKSPCIIFIDEIDAIGGSRNLKDQSAMKMTLNEMLVQMDGFESNSGIIVIGATNFKQSLDAALTRPGRFDKIVNVPLPDVQGRKQILELYGKDTKLDEKVDISILARGTPGFSGAELYNLVNQAAVKASVEGLESITHEILEWAKDKILMGAERKSAVITAETAKCTAYHEAGHALCAILVDGADPVHKATIMPRGQALGLVAQLPEGDQTSRSYKQMLAMIDVAMGGRVAEELIFGPENITSGASSDLQQATRVARAMVTKYGFSREIGYVFHSGDNGEEQSSEATRIKIDEEVKKILDDSYARVTALLKDNAKQHKRLANALLEWETLTGDECRDIVKNNRKPSRAKENHRGGAKGDTSILGGLGGVGVAAAARAE
ncbi:hypothetical protein TrVE_jg997 [Triparma verrucosa]|uniref:AAA+ ATPase domain-containing protein n=1 Tax=Triparma verrucosa TaxID=1606542 RepID=A0A9W7ESY6_9STRA|nr:hypothetical protein TrVE_jg997 [Triparma verrucosa]